MKLLTKFNLILLVLFAVGSLAISQVISSFLLKNAEHEVLQEAELMMASARSVRDYTTSNLDPLLKQNPEHRNRFLPETVAAFAAMTTFKKLKQKYPDLPTARLFGTPPIPSIAHPTGKPTSFAFCAIILTGNS